MRDSHDKFTIEIGELPRLRGRPATGRAMTAAERQKAHREKIHQEKKSQLRKLEAAYRAKGSAQLAEALSGILWKNIEKSTHNIQEIKDLWMEIGRKKGWL